nr:hypothetical protein [Parabacteroides goldsteinii]
MRGQTYIDGIDLYDAFGVFIPEGGYKGVATFPALQTPKLISWPDEDGVEVDLSQPALKSKDFQMSFAAHRKQNVGGFLELLMDKAYHDFDFRAIDRVRKLRLSAQSGLDLFNGLDAFSLQFVDDFPLLGYSYQPPQSGQIDDDGYELDGRSFADYGIHVLRGSLAEVEKSPAVKTNLLRTISGLNGAIYDGENVVFQAKDVTLRCLLRASDMREFWRNFDAFLFDLARPGERALYVDGTGLEYPCYYKSNSVSELFTVGKIWCEFSLVLSFISFRSGADEYILATEAGEWLTLEDEETLIDMGDGD